MSTWPPSDGRDDEGMPPADGGPLGATPPPAGPPPAGFPPAGSYPPPAAPSPGSYPPPGYGTPPYPPGAAGPGAYGQPYGAPAYAAQADHPAGTQVLVLGLLAFVFCQILGPVAWIQGNKAISEIDAAPWAYGNRSTVQIGRILGIISTVILALFLIGGLLFVLLIAVAGTSSST